MFFRIKMIAYRFRFLLFPALFFFSSKNTEAQPTHNHEQAQHLKESGDQYLKYNPDSALFFYRQALTLFKTDSPVINEAMVLTGMAQAAILSGHTKEAVLYTQNALVLYHELHDSAGIANAYYHIGLAFAKIKKYKEAVANLNLGFAIVKSTGPVETAYMMSRALEEVCEQSGNYKEALVFNKMYFVFLDSINSKKQKDELARLQAKFETEKSNGEMALQNKNKQAEAAEVSAQRQIKNILITGLALFLLFLLIIFSLYKKTYNTSRKLVEKNSQIHQEKVHAEQIENEKEELLAKIKRDGRISSDVEGINKELFAGTSPVFDRDKTKDLQGANADEQFIELVSRNLEVIEKALPKGDWKTIKDTIQVMTPQLITAGLTDRELFFKSFTSMDGSVAFSEWHSKTNLFCILVRKKMEELKKEKTS